MVMGMVIVMVMVKVMVMVMVRVRVKVRAAALLASCAAAPAYDERTPISMRVASKPTAWVRVRVRGRVSV